MIPNYILYRHDRQTLRPDSTTIVKKGGRLAAYIREVIHVDHSIFANANRSDEDSEIQCLLIRPHDKKSLYC